MFRYSSILVGMMMTSNSELRKKIFSIIIDWRDFNVSQWIVRYGNTSVTDIILNAVIEALPKEMEDLSREDRWTRGRNCCLALIKQILEKP